MPSHSLAAGSVDDAIKRALAADRKRRADIKDLCGKFGFDELAESLCESGASLEAAQMRVLSWPPPVCSLWAPPGTALEWMNRISSARWLRKGCICAPEAALKNRRKAARSSVP